MAQCKYCGKKGFFLSLSANGLCKNCNSIVVSKVTASARIIQDCQKLIEKSKNLEVRLGRRKLLLEHAEILLEFENKNINTIDPLPSELIDEYTPLHDKIIIEVSEREINKFLSKVEKSVTEKTKVKYVKMAIDILNKAKKIINNKSKLIVFDEKINLFIKSNKLGDVLKIKQKKITKSSNDKLRKQLEEISQPIIEEFLKNINDIEDEDELAKLSSIISSKKIRMKDELSDSIVKKITGHNSIHEIAKLLNADSDSLIKPLKRFYNTYINTSCSLLSQRISDLGAQHYKEQGGKVYWEYFGSVLDDKTREQCQIGLGAIESSEYPNAPFFTDEQKQLFQLSYGIRWDCRHEFNLITERHYNKKVDR